MDQLNNIETLVSHSAVALDDTVEAESKKLNSIQVEVHEKMGKIKDLVSEHKAEKEEH